MDWSDVPCKLWEGGRDPNGYGRRFPAKDALSSTALVQRQTYEAHVGRRLDWDECVLHRCDVPACYEIEHLWLGTQAENNADRAAKGRNRLSGACKNGHAMTPENTKIKMSRKYRCRVCLICSRKTARESAQRRRNRAKGKTA